MSTLAEQALKEIVAEKMSNPEWATIIGTAYYQLLNGEYPKSYLNALFQNFYTNPITITDAYCFAELHTMVRTGQVSVAIINIGYEPVKDEEIDQMNVLLKNLPKNFTGVFWGGTQGSDGYLAWEKPIHTTVTVSKNGEIENIGAALLCSSNEGFCELEVGYQSSVKTFSSLVSATRDVPGKYGFGKYPQLARWPYGSKYIYIFSGTYVNKDHENFNTYVNNAADTIEDCINPWNIWKKL